ncbi:hypothetical protein EYR40_000204 [Pleurotus pulmonarius]|nr:hypothetical protein EYR40_000204 [Pleurotus pulmonarius]
MSSTNASNASLYFISELPRTAQIHHRQPIVKLEASSSPDLPPDAPTQLLHLQYLASHLDQFPLDSHSSSAGPSEPATPVSSYNASAPPLFRFGQKTGHNYMSTQSWPSSSIGSPDLSAGPSDTIYRTKLDLGAMHHHHHSTVAFDEYDDDVSELVDMAGASTSHGGSTHDKSVRRRSSKACTFLGPSRKRGPPKGYIDAIEARLHQTEALLGIVLSSSDERAQTLLHDLSQDPLAKEIIKRVDNSPYGCQGRKRGDSTGGPKRHPASSSDSAHPQTSGKYTADKIDLQSTHPSNEWQDHVLSILRSASMMRGTLIQGDPETQISPTEGRAHRDVPSGAGTSRPAPPSLRVALPTDDHSDDERDQPIRRQRRRVDTGDADSYAYAAVSSRDSASPIFLSKLPHGSGSLGRGASPSYRHHRDNRDNGDGRRQYRQTPSSMDSASSGSEDELPEAVGQLSLNEDEQVRFHGKASGLYLLGTTERNDGRNAAGIWRFPKARVWPPLPDAHNSGTLQSQEDFRSTLPAVEDQEHLIELYFTYVHPSFPIIHKKSFLETYKTGLVGPEETHSPPPDPHTASTSTSSPTPPYTSRRQRRVPVLLLLTVLSVASRFQTTANSKPPYPSDGSTMWAAGDEYLDQAKLLLDRCYSSSRPAICQALLLMGYREIGIGAMAEAWTYIGMAIRMAQDLGLHRSADGWARAELGGRLFSDTELQERKRIWYGCVVMDKYVSTYIGRPLAIMESDFDTTLPDDDDPHPSQPIHGTPLPPVPGRLMTCFNASASLSNLIGDIVVGIYAVRPLSSRHGALARLERELDKWYLDLPEHLRCDIGSTKHPVPAPHILNLHLQYWCTVILLHRPFIRRLAKSKHSPIDDAGEARVLAEKSYGLCSAAANHTTAIIDDYIEFWCIKRGAVFLCYYIFTASLMHITTLSSYPHDPQAQTGLVKCMDALRRMEIVWPSAARALELLQGSKLSLEQDTLGQLSQTHGRRKRVAESCLDDLSNRSRAETQDYLGLRSSFGLPGSHAVLPGTDDNGTSIRTPYFPSYERWTSDTSHTTMPFTGPLSTSVLPQMYSSGLADERTVTPQSRSHSSSESTHGHGQRYPQYWNDYSAFTAYSNLPQSTPSAQSGSSSMYLHDQYGIYGTPQSSVYSAITCSILRGV